MALEIASFPWTPKFKLEELVLFPTTPEFELAFPLHILTIVTTSTIIYKQPLQLEINCMFADSSSISRTGVHTTMTWSSDGCIPPGRFHGIHSHANSQS